MTDPESVSKALEDPAVVQKLKELELQLTDIQNARMFAQKESGAIKFIRPALAFAAMLTVFIDVWMIDLVQNDVARQILVVMLVFLVWDIRQIYKFYFGSSDELPNMPFVKRK